MKKMDRKSLALSKETLARLSTRALRAAAGGRINNSGNTNCFLENDACVTFTKDTCATQC